MAAYWNKWKFDKNYNHSRRHHLRVLSASKPNSWNLFCYDHWIYDYSFDSQEWLDYLDNSQMEWTRPWPFSLDIIDCYINFTRECIVSTISFRLLKLYKLYIYSRNDVWLARYQFKRSKWCPTWRLNPVQSCRSAWSTQLAAINWIFISNSDNRWLSNRLVHSPFSHKAERQHTYTRLSAVSKRDCSTNIYKFLEHSYLKLFEFNANSDWCKHEN